MENSMSPADMRAVLDGSNCGYGDGWGGGMGGWWMIILFALIFGGGGFGFNNRGNCATTDELSAGLNFAGINNKLNSIGDSIASEGRNIDNSVCRLGYQTLEQTSALSAQMANCCCDLKTAIHAEGEATRNMIQENKIESLQQQLNNVNLQLALSGIPRTSPYGYGIYAYPACSGYNTCGTCGNCAY